MSDISGGLYDPDGFDVEELFDYNYDHKTIDGYQYGKKTTNEELLALECDFLIPAALGSAINEDNVDSLNCKIIIEAANGPVTGEAADKLWKKKIAIIPDILTNAGGVTVSYFEWVQNLQQFKWPEDEINQKLEQKMVAAFNEVYSVKQNNASFRNFPNLILIQNIKKDLGKETHSNLVHSNRKRRFAFDRKTAFCIQL